MFTPEVWPLWNFNGELWTLKYQSSLTGWDSVLSLSNYLLSFLKLLVVVFYWDSYGISHTCTLQTSAKNYRKVYMILCLHTLWLFSFPGFLFSFFSLSESPEFSSLTLQLIYSDVGFRRWTWLKALVWFDMMYLKCLDDTSEDSK